LHTAKTAISCSEPGIGTVISPSFPSTQVTREEWNELSSMTREDQNELSSMTDKGRAGQALQPAPLGALPSLTPARGELLQSPHWLRHGVVLLFSGLWLQAQEATGCPPPHSLGGRVLSQDQLQSPAPC